MKKRGVGLAAVNEKVLSMSPVKDAKLNGYPSVLLIGKDGKLGEFKDETGSPTNALPNARDMVMMSGIVKGAPAEMNYAEPQNVDEVPVSNATLPQEPGSKLSLGEASGTSTGMESESAEANAESAEANTESAEANTESAEANTESAEANTQSAESNASAAEPNMTAPDHIEAESSPSLETPSMDESRTLSKQPEESEDSSAVLLESLKKPATSSSNLLPPEPELEIKPKDRDSSQLGGSLYMALLEAAKATAPAAILAASASAISRRTKKFRGKRKQTRASRRR
jgi:hypothetical protein